VIPIRAILAQSSVSRVPWEEIENQESHRPVIVLSLPRRFGNSMPGFMDVGNHPLLPLHTGSDW
jgi:hypothetical protein